MNQESSADTPMLSTIESRLAGLAYLRLELRTPLNTIIGFSEMLRDDSKSAGEAELHAGFSRLHKLGQRMLHAGNSILEASKHETGTLSIGLESLAAKLRVALQPSMQETVELGAELAALCDIPGREGYAVDLRKIREAADKLFASLDTIGADPRKSDEFRIAVPVLRPQKSERPAPKPEAAMILVVDSVETNLDLLSRQLHREGHTVFIAENGPMALQMMRARKYDLVLLSVMMPEMNGYQVLEKLKASEKWREIPVIMTSALDDLDSVVRCLELGAEDYLAKPFNPILLLARIGASLEKKRLRDQQRAYVEQLQEGHRKQALLIDELATANRELAQTMERLKATQDQLIIQEKLASLGALTAGIAHEIKNPLNFVNNFAELSIELTRELRVELDRLRETPDPAGIAYATELLADLEQNAAKIQEHGKRADSIVRNMLLHSREQAGDWQPTDLNRLVDEYLHLSYHGLRGQDATFNLTMDTSYDPTIGEVNLIPQAISRVLLNIFNNACYAVRRKELAGETEFAPTLTVRTHNLPDRVEVCIRDNGSGIPAEVKEKIFTPFFTTKPPGEGTGLGLSISYDIVVQQHKGDLRVESEPGQFTEFTLALPKELA